MSELVLILATLEHQYGCLLPCLVIGLRTAPVVAGKLDAGPLGGDGFVCCLGPWIKAYSRYLAKRSR